MTEQKAKKEAKTPRVAPRKVRVTRPLNGVFPEYQPGVGKVYDAWYKDESYAATSRNFYQRVCIIEVAGKKICLRDGEYELLEVPADD